jgi:hypothetical protein
MATKLNPIIGGPIVSRHPELVRGRGTAVDGGFARKKERGEKQANHKSKKGYTGSVAGVGRGHIGGQPTVFRGGPRGPSAFGRSVQLPNRQPVPAGGVEFKPAARPGLMTRVGRQLRKRLGFGT